MKVPVRIGLLDTGVDLGPGLPVLRQRAFARADGGIAVRETAHGEGPHGNDMARLLAAAGSGVEIVSARALSSRRPVALEVIVAALEWLADEGVRMISMSFGLASDRAALADVVAALARDGVLLVAAATARGGPVYPASYPEVVAVMGDARCHDPHYSHLATRRARFGASTLDGAGQPRGASYAVPRIAAHLARRLAAGDTPLAALARVERGATFVGPERIPAGGHATSVRTAAVEARA